MNPYTTLAAVPYTMTGHLPVSSKYHIFKGRYYCRETLWKNEKSSILYTLQDYIASTQVSYVIQHYTWGLVHMESSLCIQGGYDTEKMAFNF